MHGVQELRFRELKIQFNLHSQVLDFLGQETFSECQMIKLQSQVNPTTTTKIYQETMSDRILNKKKFNWLTFYDLC